MREGKYLGGGAWVEFDGHSVILYVSNGIRRTEEVVLAPETLEVFERWLGRLKQERRAGEG